MSFPMVRRLDVWRRLEDGDRVPVGTLAQNRQGVFFQYADDYRSRFGNLSPFALALDSSLQKAPAAPHGGLHGVFADSLPDGWGLLLMDRVFRQAGVLPDQVTAMDRLAFVGERGAGALEYRPASEMGSPVDEGASSHAELGMNAQALFDGETTQLLAELVRAGSSGGARPKAQLYLPDDDSGLCSTTPVEGMRPYLVKFTSAQLALGHEEGLCEAAYLELARRAGIEVPNWRLISAPAASGAKAWLALERFDCTAAGGRLHLHSACGLLGADFRLPSLDYVDLVKASSMLCKSPAAGIQGAVLCRAQPGHLSRGNLRSVRRLRCGCASAARRRAVHLHHPQLSGLSEMALVVPRGAGVFRRGVHRSGAVLQPTPQCGRQ